MKYLKFQDRSIREFPVHVFLFRLLSVSMTYSHWIYPNN